MMLGVIVCRKPNEQLPEAYQKLLVEKYPTGFGFASPQGTHIETKLYPADEYDMAGTLKEVEQNYKKDFAFYHFLNAGTGPCDLESLQPFKLIATGEGDQEKVLVAAMAEGEFPDFEGKDEAGEGFSPEYFLVEGFLRSQVDEWFDLAGSDPKKFVEIVQKEKQKEKIASHLGPRAYVLLIPADGGATAVHNTKDGTGEFKWGFTTRTLGYKEEVKAETAPRPLTMAEKAALRKRNEQPHIDVEKTKQYPAGGTPASAQDLKNLLDNTKKPLAQCFRVNGDTLVVRPPPGANIKQARDWWKNNSSLQWPGNENAKTVYAGFPAKDLKANSPLSEFFLNTTGLGEKQPKTAESEQGPEKPVREEPKQRKEQAMTLFLDKNRKERYMELKKAGVLPQTDTAVLRAYMRDFPPMSAQLGEDQSTFLNMAVEGYARIGHDVGVHALVCLLNEYRNTILELAPAEAKPGEEKVEPQPAAQPTPAEAQKPLTMAEKAALRKQKAA